MQAENVRMLGTGRTSRKGMGIGIEVGEVLSLPLLL